MRVLIVGDLHIHPHYGDWRKVDDGLAVLDWVFKLSVDNDVAAVIFLGDIFHVRSYLYPSVIARVYKRISQYRDVGIEPIMIVGNHDMPYRETTRDNCLTSFQNIATVVDGVLRHDLSEGYSFVFAAFSEDNDALAATLDQVWSEERPQILFGHLDVMGATMNNFIASDTGLSTTYLERYHQVFSGHYHKGHMIGENVVYVGTPYQISFNESGQRKYVILWEDGQYKFIFNTFSPIHQSIDVGEYDKIKENAYLRVFVNSSADIAEATRIINENHNVRDIKFVVRGSEGEEVEEELVGIKPREILKRWVDSLETERPKERILSVGLKILEECDEV